MNKQIIEFQQTRPHIIKNFVNQCFLEGVLDNVQVRMTEKYNKRLLGSTDRKGYTVELSMSCGPISQITLIEVQPWDTLEILEERKKRAKNEFAQQIYQQLKPYEQ